MWALKFPIWAGLNRWNLILAGVSILTSGPWDG